MSTTLIDSTTQTRPPIERPLRVVVYPRVDNVNQYIPLFYRALEPYGVTLAGRLSFNDRHLTANADSFDALHVHWTHHDLWRGRGRGFVGAARGLGGMWRFLRLARKLGKRVLWTVHDLENLDKPLRSDRYGNTMLGRMADLVICHTDATRQRLIRHYWGNPRTTIVMRHGNYDGVFPSPRPRTETLSRLGLDPARPVLVGAGLIRGYKGYASAIEAVRTLGQQFQLVIAGEPYRGEPELGPELTTRAAGMPNVKLLLRRVDDTELADLYAAADCVLLPYERITGSGALLTSLTLGRGVVATELPFFREELAPESRAGVLVKPGDAGALAHGIKTFFATDVPERHAAARRLADRLAWSEVVKPVGERLQALRPGGTR